MGAVKPLAVTVGVPIEVLAFASSSTGLANVTAGVEPSAIFWLVVMVTTPSEVSTAVATVKPKSKVKSAPSTDVPSRSSLKVTSIVNEVVTAAESIVGESPSVGV